MVRTKKEEKQEKRRAHYKKKKTERNLFKKYWKPERKVKKPSVDVDGLCSSREILS